MSWRRGKRFGTILVNLQTHKIIDLLADREAESVQKWLAKLDEDGLGSAPAHTRNAAQQMSKT